MAHRYLHLDVFTDRALEGNQLAVFPDGQGVPAASMQAIAKEMAFSETTFVLPAEAPDTDVRMRIFTPADELPMAGHPTIGTTFALAREGAIASGRERFVFGLGVGPTPVDLEWKDGSLAFAWMTQGVPEFGRSFNREAVAALVGLDAIAVPDGPAPQIVSCGLPYVLLPLASRDEVDRASPRLDRIDEFFANAGVPPIGLFVFALDEQASSEGVQGVYSRMFAPHLGVFEDPATGSASGPLGCFIVANGLAGAGDVCRILSRQGVKMGRPSRVSIEITGGARSVSRVRVGGTAVLVAEGTMF